VDGEDGAPGAPGASGASGVVQIVALSAPGNSGSALPPMTTGDMIFAGPITTVTLTATQRLTGFASVSAEQSFGGTTQFLFHLCYRLLPSGDVTQFNFNGATTSDHTTDFSVTSTGDSKVPGVAGDYTVGPCMYNVGPGFLNLTTVTGWIMVSN
jgi:hypothetical protein